MAKNIPLETEFPAEVASLFLPPACIRARTIFHITQNGALEIDHARIIGGSPPAPLRAKHFTQDRDPDSYRGALQRLCGDRGHRVRHAVDPSVLISTERQKPPPDILRRRLLFVNSSKAGL